MSLKVPRRFLSLLAVSGTGVNAGLMTLILLFPIDTVKSRLQAAEGKQTADTNIYASRLHLTPQSISSPSQPKYFFTLPTSPTFEVLHTLALIGHPYHTRTH